MWQGPATLFGQTQSQIPQPHASPYRRNTSIVDRDILKRLETDNDTAILASRAKRSVRMSTALGLHFDPEADGAKDGRRNVLISCGEDDDGRNVLKAEVVWGG